MDFEREKYIHSVNLNIHTDFPYVVLDVVNDTSYPLNPGFHVMHWHEDLQFVYVLNGTIEVRTLDRSVRIQTGEGIFINKNVVHYVGRIGTCHYNSFLFPSYFLEFYNGSPAKILVDSVTENEQLPLYPFTLDTDWHACILSAFQRLVEMERNKTDFYAYEVLVCLSSIWLTMRKNVPLPAAHKHNTVNLRMQKILRYMEQHYVEDLTLADLARSANISKSECARCFHESLHTTPYKYLTEIRLSKAAQLLKETEEPIGNIAASVGFHQISHFGKCFREKTGYSPRAYRAAKQDIRKIP